MKNTGIMIIFIKMYPILINTGYNFCPFNILWCECHCKKKGMVIANFPGYGVSMQLFCIRRLIISYMMYIITNLFNGIVVSLFVLIFPFCSSWCIEGELEKNNVYVHINVCYCFYYIYFQLEFCNVKCIRHLFIVIK